MTFLSNFSGDEDRDAYIPGHMQHGDQASSEAVDTLVREVQEALIRHPDYINAAADRAALIDVIARDKLVEYTRRAASDGLPRVQISADSFARLVRDTILGWGAAEELMTDSSIEEVKINAPHSVWYVRAGEPGWQRAAHLRFSSWPQIRNLVNARTNWNGNGKPITEQEPTLDAQLEDGSRLHAAMFPVTRVPGPVVTIRKHRSVARELSYLVQSGHMGEGAAAFLEALVRARRSIAVTGGTASGKTTVINALSELFLPDENIVTCEDTAELHIRAPLWTSLLTKPASPDGRGEVTMTHLVKNCLRMRPDRILIGEVRDRAMADVIQACNTGHDGTLFTVHANDVYAAINRMKVLTRMNPDLSRMNDRDILDMISEGIHYIVHVSAVRVNGEPARRLTGIAAVAGVQGSGEDAKIELIEIYRYSPSDPKCRELGRAVFLDRPRPYHLEVLHNAVPGFDLKRDVIDRP